MHGSLLRRYGAYRPIRVTSPMGTIPTSTRHYPCTIAEPGSMKDTGHAMACHESHDAHCIGWLVNQIGEGNNIPLRIRMMDCANASRIELRGEQHRSFDDTLPDD